MTKIDARSDAFLFQAASKLEASVGGQRAKARRLIVIAPPLEANAAEAAQRVWELADAMTAEVQIIGLFRDAQHEQSVRRQLVTMAAMVKDDRGAASIEAISETAWMQNFKSLTQAGDVLVCFGEASENGLRGRMSQMIRPELNIPLYVIAGSFHQEHSSEDERRQIAGWLGSIAIIAGFFAIQVRIDTLATDATNTILFIASICAEALALWFWNTRI